MCVLFRAALGAAEGVSEVIKVVEGEGGLEVLGIEDDKEEYLYTAFYKSKPPLEHTIIVTAHV